MKPAIFFWGILQVLFLCPLYAQISDNFTDSDLTSNPPWTFNQGSFVVTNGVLQSNGPNATGQKLSISTPLPAISKLVWEFVVDLQFAPSSTNYTKIYLTADNTDLTMPLNGYYIFIGQTGADTIRFYKQTGSSSTKLFSASSVCFTSTTAKYSKVRIKVERTENGLWTFYTDCAGGQNYSTLGSVNDGSLNIQGNFGFMCGYSTTSRYNLFQFDDVNIHKLVTDTIPPMVSSVNVKDQSVQIDYNEAIDLSSVNQNLFQVTNNSIDSIKFISSSTIEIYVHDKFLNRSQVELNYSGIRDLSGNSADSVITCQYFKPENLSVLISEIYPDPSPSFGLPDYEYVEIYNNDDFPIQLKDWKISDGSSIGSLPAFTILPDSFLVLTSTAGASAFSGFGRVIGVSGFPSLNNSGDSLILYDTQMNKIYALHYDLSWYHDEAKASGGYSMEMISSNDLCLGFNNWSVSASIIGGTPGIKNSLVSNQDVFKIQSSAIVNDTTINLIFNSSPEASQNLQSKIFINQISPDNILISGDTICITFNNSLSQNGSVNLTVLPLLDCRGKVSEKVNLVVNFPKKPSRGDIILSEIYADESPTNGLPAYEYIELYNRSQFNVALDKAKICDASGCSEFSANIGPGDFLILTSSAAVNAYSVFGNVISVSNFPSLNNAGDDLYLKNQNDEILFSISYDDSWYGNKNKSEGGYSLEIIDPAYYCVGKNNWTSSSNSMGGTPGTVNSVNAVNPDQTAPAIAQAYFSDSLNLIINFTERIDTLTFSQIKIYFEPELESIQIQILNEGFGIHLSLKNKILGSEKFLISLSGIKDCSGNKMDSTIKVEVLFPEIPLPGDIVINEILYNPETGGSDFIEFYNKSEKILSLNGSTVRSINLEGDTTTMKLESRMVLKPDDYVVIASDSLGLVSFFPKTEVEKVSIDKLKINFPDAGGFAAIINSLGILLDEIPFNDKMHHPLITNPEGVSLERISVSSASLNFSNWHSASESAGFATPGYVNSQSHDSGLSRIFSVSPSVVSPDNDGRDDYLLITWPAENAGMILNATVYDISGTKVSTIVANYLTGEDTFLRWDGLDNTNVPLREGFYIILLDAFDANGKTEQLKKTVVVAY